jgi:transposase-like protein
VLPTIAEVILVLEALMDAQPEIGEMHASRVDEALGAMLTSVNHEAMQMRLAPAEGDLQRSVQVGNGAVASNEQASPDQRADAAQDDAQLVTDGFGCRVRFRHAAIVRLPFPSLPPVVCPVLVSNRTVLRWVQAFGPQLAAEARKHRRPHGRTWYTDEMFFFRGKDKWYLDRAVDEHGQVVDVLLRDHRDTASAEAFFQQALGRSGQVPSTLITEHHQPYVKAIQRSVPTAEHVRSGLHGANGVTTKPIERSHVPARDRLRASRGLKTLRTGQCFLEGFECLRALRGGHIRLADVLPGSSASASRHDHVRTVAAAVLVLGMRLNRTPRSWRSRR